MAFADYQITGELGRGGQGIVLRARDAQGRDLAIKVLNGVASDDAKARFSRERRLLDGLGEAQGFVQLVDAGDGPHGPFIVMPFLAGGDLRRRLKEGSLPIDATIALGKELAGAMARAHALGIIHRDLKPENVLFTGDGRPLVSDMGLAKHFRHDSPGASQSVALSKTGDFRGTVGYMAPEQMGDAREAGPPCDVFALGAILYECLTGQPAFQGESLHEVLYKVASGSVSEIRELRPDAPRWLMRLVVRCLRQKPEQRYANAGELLRALEDGPASDKRRALKGAVAALGLVLAGGGLALVPWPQGAAAPPPGGADAATVPPAGAGPKAPPRARAIPEWFEALAKEERPPHPLPRGLSFGANPGEYVNAKDGSILVYCPAATFIMGGEVMREKPPHEVEVSASFIGKYELTTAQWEAFAKATGHKTLAEKNGSSLIRERQGEPQETEQAGASWRFPRGGKTAADPTHPVVQVSWEDGVAYCKWAGLRLPTEAEWERAAGWDRKAKKMRVHPWGAEAPAQGSLRFGNFSDEQLRRARPALEYFFEGYDDGFVDLAPVGSFPQGASPCGALDMLGNAFEWCYDGYDDGFYARSPKKNPVCDPATTQLRTARGESYCHFPRNVHVAYRICWSSFYACEDTGFRVGRDGS